MGNLWQEVEVGTPGGARVVCGNGWRWRAESQCGKEREGERESAREREGGGGREGRRGRESERVRVSQKERDRDRANEQASDNRQAAAAICRSVTDYCSGLF